LVNGVLNTGSLRLGDVDVWSFTANAGDAPCSGRVGGFDSVDSALRALGQLVKQATSANSNVRDIYLTAQATDSGIYTVVLSSGSLVSLGPTI